MGCWRGKARWQHRVLQTMDVIDQLAVLLSSAFGDQGRDRDPWLRRVPRSLPTGGATGHGWRRWQSLRGPFCKAALDPLRQVRGHTIRHLRMPHDRHKKT